MTEACQAVALTLGQRQLLILRLDDSADLVGPRSSWKSAAKPFPSVSQPIWQRLLWLAILLISAGGAIRAQDEIEVVEGPIIDQRPFDVIHLKAAAGGGQYKVLPIPFPQRKLPASPGPTDTIQVVLLQFPDQKYAIAWKSIEKLELYEDLVIEDARQRLEQNDFIGAFQNLSFMLRNYPSFPRLAEMQREFLWKSLLSSFQAGQLEQTFSGLEELRRLAPQFHEREAMTALNRIASRLVQRYEKQSDLASAQKLLKRLASTYGDIDVVVEWRKRVDSQASSKQKEAEDLFRQQRYREARQAASISVSLNPQLESARQLMSEINRAHPMVRVGVMQRCGQENDPSSLINWAARRAGQLTNQPLFQFRDIGSEGGNYAFALGSYRLSDEHDQMILQSNRQDRTAEDLTLLANFLVAKANPLYPLYDPAWAAIFSAVEATGGNQMTVRLRQPHVLPHALLQWPIPADEAVAWSLSGLFSPPEIVDQEVSFRVRNRTANSELPVEVVEMFYADPKQAINDLLRGEIDVIDQLYPADAKRLSGESRLSLMSYALPSVHLLIPLSDHPYLAKEKFRRALLLATNRKAMLEGELLNSSNSEDGRLISGPFPVGNKDSDPLAYAYDPSIQPVTYNPQLAKLFTVLVEKELQIEASKNGRAKPSMDTLVVGCPDFEFARVAVQALIQQWSMIGISAQMKVLEPNALNGSAECDLLYVVATLWEPATDIHRLLGDNGVAPSDNPYVIQALYSVYAATNWRETREALRNMHQVVAYHLPILPLWQITDRFVVRQGLSGLVDRPVSLYQNIRNWRLK